jgi:error-prone DNA polymerase
MASIPHNAPVRFYDLVVQVAIIRPGPIVGKMMHPYMRRRQGKEVVTYPHPSLEPVLKRTLGVPLFQEQLLRMAMVVASFTGAEAEELRRAVGMRRSMQRMKDLEGRLRSGMTRNGIGPDAQDNIVQGISSFAMYGFPESHAASFALIAYASAWLKVHFLAAFTCGLLNNQPMGFYSPAVLIKDAQRHGLRVRPIDVLRSDWLCTLEDAKGTGPNSAETLSEVEVLKGHDFSRADEANKMSGALAPEGCFSGPTLRIGLNYVKGLRQSSAEAIIAARNLHGPFSSVDEFSARVSALNRKELVALAQVGALNALGDVAHRRDALWQVEQAGRPVGPLLRRAAPADPATNPLRKMSTDERLAADYAGTGITTGPHPMAYQRESLRRLGVLSAAELESAHSEQFVRAAGRVVARQRPGTAKGFVFLSLEDETGIANIIVAPDVFEQNRIVVTRTRFLLIAGKLQNQEGVVHVKARYFEPLDTSLEPVVEAPHSWR